MLLVWHMGAHAGLAEVWEAWQEAYWKDQAVSFGDTGH